MARGGLRVTGQCSVCQACTKPWAQCPCCAHRTMKRTYCSLLSHLVMGASHYVRKLPETGDVSKAQGFISRTPLIMVLIIATSHSTVTSNMPKASVTRLIHTQGLIIKPNFPSCSNEKEKTGPFSHWWSICSDTYQVLQKFYRQKLLERQRVCCVCYLLSIMGLQNLTDALLSRHYSVLYIQTSGALEHNRFFS